MKIKWESNSRVQNLAGQGKIDPEDIIKRTQTNNFPAETATVRMAKVREQEPWVTIHIRGAGVKRTNNFNNYSWIAAPVMRVNFGSWANEYCVSGELDGRYDFADVDQVVKEVATILKS